MVIDARDQGCPKPVMMAEEALSKITEGIVEVLVDNEASADNLAWFAKNNAFFSETTCDGRLCLVCPVTPSIKGYPFEVSLDGAQKTSGVALADQVRSIDWQARKIKIVDSISKTSLTTILAKVKPLLF
jgi:TusA-related sulfurtransferase